MKALNAFGFLFSISWSFSAGAYGPEKSGSAWCNRYPGSTQLGHLDSTFAPKVSEFVDALREAGATVTVSSTRRPDERQYLMHWCWHIGKRHCFLHDNPCPGPGKEWKTNPIPPYEKHNDCKIIWFWYSPPTIFQPQCSHNCSTPHTHRYTECTMAAEKMLIAYQLGFGPSRNSRHVEGKAVDMNISWSNSIAITTKSGSIEIIESLPRDGRNNHLKEIGASYGVIRNSADYLHWSTDGH